MTTANQDPLSKQIEAAQKRSAEAQALLRAGGSGMRLVGVDRAPKVLSLTEAAEQRANRTRRPTPSEPQDLTEAIEQRMSRDDDGPDAA
jgi:hypothetical protein